MDIKYETQLASVGTLNALCPRCDTQRLLTKHKVTAHLMLYRFDVLPVPAGSVFQCSTCRTYSRKPSLFDRLLFTVALLALLPMGGVAIWVAVWMARGLIDAEERAPLKLWAMLLGLLLLGAGALFFMLRSLVRLWRRPLTPVDEDSMTHL